MFGRQRAVEGREVGGWGGAEHEFVYIHRHEQQQQEGGVSVFGLNDVRAARGRKCTIMLTDCLSTKSPRLPAAVEPQTVQRQPRRR